MSRQRTGPHIIEEIDGKKYYRAVNADGSLRKLRNGKREPIKENKDHPVKQWVAEGRAKSNARRKMIMELSGGAIRPWRFGVFDGYNKETAAVVWQQAQDDAKKLVKYMKENGMVETPADKYGEMADEALEAAITVMRTPMRQQDKLAAARLVLDFTKSKPVAKSEVNVKTAESWLDDVMADITSNE